MRLVFTLFAEDVRLLPNEVFTGDIFLAWSDEPWILDGAAVRVSLVGFDNGRDTEKLLNGQGVEDIYPDLTSKVDISNAKRLAENASTSFEGVKAMGPFDILYQVAETWISLPNPSGQSIGPIAKVTS